MTERGRGEGTDMPMNSALITDSMSSEPAPMSVLEGVRLVCLVNFFDEPPCAAEALAKRMGATITRVPCAALIQEAAIRHRRAVRLLRSRYAGILCASLGDSVVAELTRVSGLQVLDTRALLSLEGHQPVQQGQSLGPLGKAGAIT